ncbi:putative transcriptional acitvator, Baf family [Emticicia oligotrophica DSM 17448]|uniref:Type III pantothenate kinase n=1 Tax=Emticicia oligotrophica (strain DSM 17448 / CIP 109782 / MTCC 6937 / GPTSA100-15) TaxID=929562 RepID=A0ABM5N5W7_EMTOG|nr:type III pantothenate kinase [Emticicia oligotrophica]AFK04823.1 putative transcriptional acitvator, Baf family [Emticicia oligotrophica DSM 17448]
MNAVVDIGNTTAKAGFFKDNNLIEIKRGLTLEEIEALILLNNVKNVLISSVTKSQQELELIFDKVSVNKLYLTTETPIPIAKHYDTPQTLGSDRLAAAVGANFLFPKQDVLIIDMGTAIKYDYVSALGAFEGGIISPGMRIRFKALHTFTKRLPFVEAREIPELVGKNTKACIESGVINGIIAEVNGMIEKYSEKGIRKVILCGGDASFFESQIKKPTFALDFGIDIKNKNSEPQFSIEHISNLTLIGLNRILQYNVEKN